jgi:hypothetical protein
MVQVACRRCRPTSRARRWIRRWFGETLDAPRGLSRNILFDTLLRQAMLLLAVASLVWFAVPLVPRPLMRLKTEV